MADCFLLFHDPEEYCLHHSECTVSRQKQTGTNEPEEGVKRFRSIRNSSGCFLFHVNNPVTLDDSHLFNSLWSCDQTKSFTITCTREKMQAKSPAWCCQTSSRVLLRWNILNHRNGVQSFPSEGTLRSRSSFGECEARQASTNLYDYDYRNHNCTMPPCEMSSNIRQVGGETSI